MAASSQGPSSLCQRVAAVSASPVSLANLAAAAVLSLQVLVLGGGGLMAAFPLAYSILMPALYTPVIAMLIGLIFRGVAFEFRTVSRGNRVSESSVRTYRTF